MITEQQKKIYNEYVNKDISFDDFVSKANEIYFNLEPEVYDEKHPEISQHEDKRWNNLASKYFLAERLLQILDIGSGSGFVANHVCKNLKKTDTFTFLDVSEDMLEFCRKRFNGKFVCEIDFKKLNGKSLDFPPNSFDIATMNSVLHHIPDTEYILKEINRVLKPGGRLIIAHEVNMVFFQHPIVWTNYRIMRMFKNKKNFLEGISKHFGLTAIYRRFFKNVGQYDDLLEKVNEELMRGNFITKPLSPAKLGLLMEVYSSIGFDVPNMASHTRLVLMEKKTYNHLHDDPKSWPGKFYDKILSVLFPDAGKNFIAIFQKS